MRRKGAKQSRGRKRKIEETVNESTSTTVDKPGSSVYESEYEVEHIRDIRFIAETGDIEYLVKWENWPEKQNTWEPRQHLEGCEQAIARFQADMSVANSGNMIQSYLMERNFIPNKIEGMADSPQERFGVCFLLSFKSTTMGELLPSAVANKVVPNLVLEFYERLRLEALQRPLSVQEKKGVQEKTAPGEMNNNELEAANCCEEAKVNVLQYVNGLVDEVMASTDQNG